SGGFGGGSSRQEKSLGLLTTKFVSLLQEAKEGVLDLKAAGVTLAVRQKRIIYDAPSGTQLEVPIPEMGQNGQKKYQINLKSHSGPIHVLLINKESGSSKPVVFPVPPPDDLTQPSSQSSTPVTPQKSSMLAQNSPEQHVSKRSQSLQQIPATEIASAGSISGDIIDELMSSDVFPLLRLSPTPADDYNFNLDDNEGVCDLFDVQILNY
ncbi:Transcription factor E2F5, partial [Heterocephalus glaber]